MHIIENKFTYGIIEGCKIIISSYSYIYLICYVFIFLIYIIFNIILWIKFGILNGFNSKEYFKKICVLSLLVIIAQIFFNKIQNFTIRWQDKLYRKILLTCKEKIINSSLEEINLDDFNNISQTLVNIETIKMKFFANLFCFITFLLFNVKFVNYSQFLFLLLFSIKLLFIFAMLSQLKKFLKSQDLFYENLITYREILNKNEKFILFNKIINYFSCFFIFGIVLGTMFMEEFSYIVKKENFFLICFPELLVKFPKKPTSTIVLHGFPVASASQESDLISENIKYLKMLLEHPNFFMLLDPFYSIPIDHDMNKKPKSNQKNSDPKGNNNDNIDNNPTDRNSLEDNSLKIKWWQKIINIYHRLSYNMFYSAFFYINKLSVNITPEYLQSFNLDFIIILLKLSETWKNENLDIKKEDLASNFFDESNLNQISNLLGYKISNLLFQQNNKLAKKLLQIKNILSLEARKFIDDPIKINEDIDTIKKLLDQKSQKLTINEMQDFVQKTERFLSKDLEKLVLYFTKIIYEHYVNSNSLELLYNNSDTNISNEQKCFIMLILYFFENKIKDDIAKSNIKKIMRENIINIPSLKEILETISISNLKKLILMFQTKGINLYQLIDNQKVLNETLLYTTNKEIKNFLQLTFSPLLKEKIKYNLITIASTDILITSDNINTTNDLINLINKSYLYKSNTPNLLKKFIKSLKKELLSKNMIQKSKDQYIAKVPLIEYIKKTKKFIEHFYYSAKLFSKGDNQYTKIPYNFDSIWKSQSFLFELAQNSVLEETIKYMEYKECGENFITFLKLDNIILKLAVYSFFTKLSMVFFNNFITSIFSYSFLMQVQENLQSKIFNSIKTEKKIFRIQIQDSNMNLLNIKGENNVSVE